ncbi:unannotated protein [freshwater metagenome]|uniref:Unannotated protein n=1 Tax=freshwater metagenome TaxID=449393 RepID=A0A6J7Q073_9ZZZZ
MLIADHDGGLVQPFGPTRVAEAIPQANGVGDVGSGEICGRGPSVEPEVPARDHPVDLCLLAHEFAHEDAPGGDIRAAPGQRTARIVEPGEHWFDKARSRIGKRIAHQASMVPRLWLPAQ